VSVPATSPVRASWGPKKRAAVRIMPGSDLQQQTRIKQGHSVADTLHEARRSVPQLDVL
jgi:hypothetical protein